jgi:hypothetical protein
LTKNFSKSTSTTTNLHFGDSASVVPNASCATALIDRIVPPDTVAI